MAAGCAGSPFGAQGLPGACLSSLLCPQCQTLEVRRRGGSHWPEGQQCWWWCCNTSSQTGTQSRQPALFHPSLGFGYRICLAIRLCEKELRHSSGWGKDPESWNKGSKRMLLPGKSMSGVTGKSFLYSNHTVSYSGAVPALDAHACSLHPNVLIWHLCKPPNTVMAVLKLLW